MLSFLYLQFVDTGETWLLPIWCLTYCKNAGLHRLGQSIPCLSYFGQFRRQGFICDKGCLSLFGRDPEAHRLLAEHLTSDYRVKTEGRGRVVDEWKLRPETSENAWLDCLVGCGGAASIQGVHLRETDVRPVQKRDPIRLSSLRRARR